MSTEKNIASQDAFGEAVNQGNLDALDDRVTADSLDHDPAPGQGSGPAGYKTFFWLPADLVPEPEHRGRAPRRFG